MRIIDAHTHIFPDKIAEKAAENIGAFYGLKMYHNGTVSSLLETGKKAGIDKYIVHSVAVTKEQVSTINDYIAQECREHTEFIGFASLHPDMGNPRLEIERVIKLGLRGVKLHPDFQEFAVNGREAARLFEVLEGELPVIIHAGDCRYEYSNPKKIADMLNNFPKLDIICAHFGGYSEWDDSVKYLAGRGIWVDTSSSLAFMSKDKANELISMFGEDYVVFGTDYPMWDACDEIRLINALELKEETKNKIMYKNILRLLGDI